MSKSTRKRPVDDHLNPSPPPADENAMEVEAPAAVAPKRRIVEDVSFVDDDDLQATLALKRRAALKKRKIVKPAELARLLHEESLAVDANGTNTPGAMDQDGEEGDTSGLVIDQTSEFVATLRAPTAAERKTVSVKAASPEIRAENGDDDDDEDDDDDDDGDDDDDVDMVRDERSPSAKPKSEATPAPAPAPTAPAFTSTGLEEETTISRGIGATLAMLNQRGLLKRDPDADKKAVLARERDKFRAQKRIHELEAEEKAKAARLRDRQSGKFERMSAREREEHARWENKQRDQQEAREMAQRFKDYKPDVTLSYKDEFGREMTQKEVFIYYLSLSKVGGC